jgi:hypothetical protein
MTSGHGFVTLKRVFAVHCTGTMGEELSGATTPTVSVTNGAPAAQRNDGGTPSPCYAHKEEIIRFRQPVKIPGENP